MKGRDWASRFRPGSDPASPAHEEDRVDASFTRRSTGMIVLAVLVAFGLAALVIRITGADLLFDANRTLAASLMPGDPRGLFRRAIGEAQFTGTVSEKLREDITAAFRKAPLAEEPLLVGAVDALAHGDEARASRLIEIAHRRDPRSRYALMLLLQDSLRRADAEQGVAAMAVLARLLPQASDLLVAELARMASQPRTKDVVRRVMEGEPRIRTDVLERLARGGAEPSLLFHLAGQTAPVAAGETPPRWQQLMVDELVSHGRVAEAFDAWQRISGSAGNPGGIYDGDFTGLPGPAPFNWSLASSGAGLAEMQRGSPGLRVDYYARDPAQLASQLLMLPPGRYQLSFQADLQAEGEGGADRIAWTLACHPDGRQLSSISLAGGTGSRTISGVFTVPENGCPSQWLRLVGSPAEFPKDQQATITHLRITRAG